MDNFEALRKQQIDDIVKIFKIKPSILREITGSYSRNQKIESEFVKEFILPWLVKHFNKSKGAL